MATVVPLSQGFSPGALAAIRTGVRAGRFVYANRKAATKAATTFQRMYRGRQSRRSTIAANKSRALAIGESMHSPDNKKFESLAGAPTSLDTRTLYLNDMTAIPKTTVAAIDSRQRHFANVKGFSINWMIKNTTSAAPITVNIAVVAGKGQKVPTAAGWFRDYTSSRDVDFSTGLNSNEIHTYPISTDKYTVLWHKRCTIGGVGNANNGAADRTYISGNKYVKLGRQIRYNDDTDDLGENRVYIAYWFDTVSTPGGGAVVAGQAYTSIRTVTFFDDEARPY